MKKADFKKGGLLAFLLLFLKEAALALWGLVALIIFVLVVAGVICYLIYTLSQIPPLPEKNANSEGAEPSTTNVVVTTDPQPPTVITNVDYEVKGTVQASTNLFDWYDVGHPKVWLIDPATSGSASFSDPPTMTGSMNVSLETDTNGTAMWVARLTPPILMEPRVALPHPVPQKFYRVIDLEAYYWLRTGTTVYTNVISP